MQNLRDKLLKAGLVSEKDARQVEVEAEKKRSAPRPPPAERTRQPRPSPPPAAAPIPRLPPLALPGSKAFQRLEALKQQELDKRLRDLVYAAQVAVEPGEHRFHFVTRKGKLRRLEVSEAQAKQLEDGVLAVVERQEPAMIEHSLVPAATAETMIGLSAKAVRFFNRPGAPVGFVGDEDAEAPQGSEAE